ncbi:hypothetical protein FOXYSP1_15321 [Fusarium oxysporum f. sp. phaseoli]
MGSAGPRHGPATTCCWYCLGRCETR